MSFSLFVLATVSAYSSRWRIIRKQDLQRAKLLKCFADSDSENDYFDSDFSDNNEKSSSTSDDSISKPSEACDTDYEDPELPDDNVTNMSSLISNQTDESVASTSNANFQSIHTISSENIVSMFVYIIVKYLFHLISFIYICSVSGDLKSNVLHS